MWRRRRTIEEKGEITTVRAGRMGGDGGEEGGRNLRQSLELDLTAMIQGRGQSCLSLATLLLAISTLVICCGESFRGWR